MLRDRVLGHLTADQTILDLGAGAGIVEQMNFRGHARRVCGIDLDPRVETNPFLDEGKQTDGASIPYADNTFDLVVSDNVLEHLERPAEVFTEVRRVLKPGGLFLFKTPNKWHYMPLISRLTPHKFHQWVNRKRGRAEVDTFPTLYRANSSGDVRRLAKETGYEVQAVELIEGRPEYLRIHPVTYAGGVVYERLVNGLPFLKGLRVVLIGTLRKPL
jgi:Methylase involved in ubiquinone/menaquinone biosynthesis